MPRPPLVLASTSPYRRALLARLQVPFDVVAPEVDEQVLAGENGPQTALRLAQDKAKAPATRFPGTLIIGSDQVAILDGVAIGKPGNRERAVEQLQGMRGKEVLFHTGIAVHDTRSGKTVARLVNTTVCFRDYTDATIERYLRLEPAYDCAGSAKVEGLGITLIRKLEGEDPNALIGLPLIALIDLLAEQGYPLP